MSEGYAYQSNNSVPQSSASQPMRPRLGSLVEQTRKLTNMASELCNLLGVPVPAPGLREAMKPNCEVDEHLISLQRELDEIAGRLSAALERI